MNDHIVAPSKVAKRNLSSGALWKSTCEYTREKGHIFAITWSATKPFLMCDPPACPWDVDNLTSCYNSHLVLRAIAKPIEGCSLLFAGSQLANEGILDLSLLKRSQLILAFKVFVGHRVSININRIPIQRNHSLTLKCHQKAQLLSPVLQVSLQ
jgi:hypothetical protein